MTVRTASALTARYVSSRQPGLPVERGDVVDDVDAARRRASSDARVARGRRATSSMPASSEMRGAPAPDRGPARGRRRRARASARARWPPVKPVAPVTRTRNAPPRPSPAIRRGAAARARASAPSIRSVAATESEPLVQRDRQHELPVLIGDAEPVAVERVARPRDRRTRGRPRRARPTACAPRARAAPGARRRSTSAG